MTVTGAAVGDFVLASCAADLQELQLTGQVRTANTVELTLSNSTGSSVDLGNSTFYARVYSR